MAPGERGEPFDGAVEVGDQGIDRRAQLEHERGVDDVLAGRAPMHVARGRRIGLGDLGGERVDQRDGDIAGGDGRFAQRGEVVAFGPAASAIGSTASAGTMPTAASRARQRDLEIEHALHPRAIVEDGAHGRAGEQRGQQEWERGLVIRPPRPDSFSRPRAGRQPPAAAGIQARNGRSAGHGAFPIAAPRAANSFRPAVTPTLLCGAVSATRQERRRWR